MPPATPARRATVERRDALATRLVSIAEDVIARRGLDQLRARALADAAGCSVGAIYGAFPDLDELILTVNQRTLDQIDAALSADAEEGRPMAWLVRLALAYLDYATVNRPRWAALFQHRMASGRLVPAWYAVRRQVAFRPVAAAMASLRPDLGAAEQADLARSLFSAVHGIVALGLDELLGAMPSPALRNQVTLVVEAMARGLAAQATSGL